MAAPQIEVLSPPTALQLVDGDPHPLMVYLARLGSERSRRTQLARAEKLSELFSGGADSVWTFPWHRLSYVETAALRAMVSECPNERTGQPLSPRYCNALLAVLRCILKECWRLELMTHEAMARACDLEPIRGESLPAGRSLAAGEKAALGQVCQSDPSAAGPRDASIFALGFAAGLRRAEVVSLEVDDYEPSTGAVTVRRGKGNKARISHLGESCRAALDDWLAIRGDVPGPLMHPINRGGVIDRGKGVSSHAVYLCCRKRAEQAGIETFSPHDMRRTFIGDLLDSGADLSVAQKLAGHASPSTTAGYDRRPEAAKMAAVSRLHFPYVRRQ